MTVEERQNLRKNFLIACYELSAEKGETSIKEVKEKLAEENINDIYSYWYQKGMFRDTPIGCLRLSAAGIDHAEALIMDN